MSHHIDNLDFLLRVDFSKVEITGETNIFPAKDNNAFKIKVTDEKITYSPNCVFKSSYHMAEHLNKVRSEISKEEFTKLYKIFINFVHDRVEEAMFDETYDG